MPLDNLVETDVLVIGGGLAGCFAAIKAKEKGVDVTLVDKGYVSKSGQSPFAGDTCVFNPKWGHILDAWMDQVSTIGEYVNNREWNEIVFKESHARYRDLDSWGVPFLKDSDGEPRRFSHPLKTSEASPLVSESIHWDPRYPAILRKQAVKSGVKIMDRVMVTDLMKQDGRVVSAIGVPLDGFDTYLFNAKATVVSAGGAGFKPLGYPIHELTGDGHGMAYRVGVEITGKEFVAPIGAVGKRAGWPPRYFTHTHRPSAVMPGFWRGRGTRSLQSYVNAEGDEVQRRAVLAWHGWQDAPAEAHAGRAPLFTIGPNGRKIQTEGGAANFGGRHGHATDGILPINSQCATSVPGLYAAGDSCGMMFGGATYSGFGFATALASVTGAKAGTAAAEYALQTEALLVDEPEQARVKQIAHAPLERQGGFSPRWVTQILQNLMLPYFVMYVKHAKRLQSTLTMIEFLRDHLVPKLYAKDPHDLRLAHETRNMVLNAEMKLRASLFRTESRGTHYREDHPRRKDPEWLAWVLLKEEQGQMKVSKKPLPKAWWPDLSTPYEERYAYTFPGEEHPCP